MSGCALRLAIICTGILGVAFAAHYAMSSKDRARIRKEFTSQPRKSEIQHTDKVHGPVEATIALVGNASSRVGDTFTLEATVVARNVVEGARFRWNIPAGLALVSGSADGQIHQVAPNSDFKTQITLRQLSNDNERVHFAVDGRDGGRTFASVSQYNSVLEETLKSQKRAVQKSMEEQARKADLLLIH
jgi:hypothetical protein